MEGSIIRHKNSPSVGKECVTAMQEIADVAPELMIGEREEGNVLRKQKFSLSLRWSLLHFENCTHGFQFRPIYSQKASISRLVL